VNQEESKIMLQGRVALVTGGGNGNGAAMAKGLAREGAQIAILDIDQEAAERTSAEIRTAGGNAKAFVGDVTDLSGCKEAAERVSRELGNVSILINNAGVIRRARLDDEDIKQAWDLCMDVNTGGVFNVTMAFLSQLRATKGSVINVASVVAFVSMDTFVGYAASKAALLGLTRNFARQLAPEGVRVNAIAPGPFETPMTQATMADQARREFYRSKIPLGRWGKPEELIGPILFLASDMSSFVTGTTLVVDGGVLTG